MITRLESKISRKICAGQDIVDLSSVVKELLENALDAEAQVVTIRLYRFGLESIVVEDDGHGIPMDGIVDLATGRLNEGATTPLLSNRATSKRNCEEEGETSLAHNSEGLSLGFRGEALHSLAHSGEVTVDTMHTSTYPYTVHMAYNQHTQRTQLRVSRARQQMGTCVTVRGLFEPFPVRRKEFMKNCRKQLLSATSLVKQYAVSHPQVRLVMTHQSDAQSAPATLVSITGSSDLARSITEAYGGRCLQHMTPVTWSLTFAEVTGYVSNVSDGGRRTADQQIFSLDGRLVDLPRLAKAINDAFAQCLPNASQRLLVGFFLQVTMKYSANYDVNLAPNKRKVLLTEESTLAEELYRAALQGFRLLSEGVNVDSQTRIAGARAADVRAAEMTRHTLTPISATALTQFVYKKAPTAEDRCVPQVDGQSGSVHGSQLGSDLYRIAVEGVTDMTSSSSTSGRSVASAVSTLSLLGSDGDGEEELLQDDCGGAVEAGVPPSSSGRGIKVKREEEDPVSDNDTSCPCRPRLEGCEESIEESIEESCSLSEDASEVVVLTDSANQQREAAAHLNISFPSWASMEQEALFPSCTAAVAGDEPARPRRQPFSTLQKQTDSELTTFFSKQSFKHMEILGQFNHGFIVAAVGGEMFVIDQHAADEKHNYERLMKDYAARPQPLVVPVPVGMEAFEVELAIVQRDALLQHGFDVGPGADSTKLLVRSLPVLPYDVVNPSDVLELVQQLVQYGSIVKPLRAVWHSMATKACRSSIMIGRALPVQTMRSIVKRMGDLDQPWNCPHGRPTLRHVCNVTQLKQSMPTAAFWNNVRGGPLLL